ncbi:MAG TPA: hypothetical protein VGJ33_17265 [Candidatus Angelobacter sp.]
MRRKTALSEQFDLNGLARKEAKSHKFCLPAALFTLPTCPVTPASKNQEQLTTTTLEGVQNVSHAREDGNE